MERETTRSIIFASQFGAHRREGNETFQITDNMILSMLKLKTWEPKPPRILLLTSQAAENLSNAILYEHSYFINMKRKFKEEESTYKKSKKAKVNYLNKPNKQKRN